MVAALLSVAVLLVAAGAPSSGWQPPSAATAARAASFVATLARESPDHDGVPLRRYLIEDLDGDGACEVLEYVSAFERSPGFLNAELAPAFEWVKVYRYRAGEYREDTTSFRGFLAGRRQSYEFWLRVLENPAVLGQDSRALIRANGEEFKRILKGYVDRTRGMER